MTVYVVTSGEYSDYRVRGVYATLQDAEFARKLFGTLNNIDEYVVGELPDHPQGMFRFEVVMSADGQARASLVDCTEKSFVGDWRPWGDSVRFTMWARDAEHAVKIANERRIQLLASGQWTTSRKEWLARQRMERQKHV